MPLLNQKLSTICSKNKKAIAVSKIITAILPRNNLKLIGLKEQ
jgi:hypothetical protein